MPRVEFHSRRRRSAYSAFWMRRWSSVSGWFQAGMLKFGVRWNTVRCLACFAMCGMAWMPDEPVPMMPTRRPLKSTPPRGHAAV